MNYIPLADYVLIEAPFIKPEKPIKVKSKKVTSKKAGTEMQEVSDIETALRNSRSKQEKQIEELKLGFHKVLEVGPDCRYGTKKNDYVKAIGQIIFLTIDKKECVQIRESNILGKLKVVKTK